MIGILEDRERRYEETLKLIELNLGTVLCAKINYPGKNKNTECAKMAFSILRQEIYKEFDGKIKVEKKLSGCDGDSLLLIIDLPIIEVKKRSIKIETEHPLGRIFDVDIYNKDGVPLSRGDFNIQERKCIVCGNAVRECIVKKRHSVEEVLEKVNTMIKEYGDRYDK
ncbi:citrate lyase holo-[acyl-carrier protein] synthase [Caloramator sp. ALD01]|uniref:citrate lyase holo-[acyl-carrier protein] synthase n=1 Tax=Caloramator sp. ALD01 TaxID=1031288 RepID=UPI00041D2394|nr:citrate lyase holo-[acyl-carrier protein] synthase [Caloramator sp. ALD01]